MLRVKGVDMEEDFPISQEEWLMTFTSYIELEQNIFRKSNMNINIIAFHLAIYFVILVRSIPNKCKKLVWILPSQYKNNPH